MTAAAPRPILEVRGLTKSFLATRALDGVDFSVRPGEVHGLIGENGAGKSTMIKVLAGVYTADAGEILFDGRRVEPHLHAMPVAFVHQDVGLVDDLSVGENVALVAGFPKRAGLIDWPAVRRQSDRIYRLMDVGSVDPRLPVASLSAAERAILGIVRALARHARVIVLDEPTAALPEPDALKLLQVLRALRARGTSVIYVTHRLGELFKIADRVTVFRDGRVVRDVATAATSVDDLIHDMLGRRIAPADTRPRPSSAAAPILSVRGLKIGHHGPLDFDVAAGEIVGLVGLRGAGQREVGRAIFGALRHAEGQIRFDGKVVPGGEPIGRRMARGLALLPGDRVGESVFGGMTLAENLFPNAAIAGSTPWSVFRRGRERAAAMELLDRFDVRPRRPLAIIEWLSGGNQQKVAIARWLVVRRRMLILEDPTAGVDIGAKLAIYAMLRGLAATDLAILVVSSDFEEAATLCSRALVVSGGRIVGELADRHLTVDALVAASSAGAAAPSANGEH